MFDLEKIVSELRSVIGDCDDLRRRPWRGSPNPWAGHCYVASEYVYHLFGGTAGPWKPMFLRVGPTPHWFLQHKETGKRLDVTAGQFGSVLPYSEARGKGFLTSRPSKRARELANRISKRKQRGLV